VGIHDRRTDRGNERADQAARQVGLEIRRTRRAAGLSLRDAGGAVGISYSTLSRIERARLPNVSVRELALACVAVGLELGVRAFPDGDPIRDAAHTALLDRARAVLPAGTPWRNEVPLPIPGDRRAWDAVAVITRERVAFEAETRLSDIQALQRRLELKRRDGGIGILILVVADTRHNRRVLREHREDLRAAFPLDSREVTAALSTGRLPAAGGILVL
jgi:transcriptional regulator with XRE-family HTH domain